MNYTDQEVIALMTEYGFADKVFAAYDLAKRIPRKRFHGFWGPSEDSTSAWAGTLHRLVANGLVERVDRPRSQAHWYRIAKKEA